MTGQEVVKAENLVIDQALDEVERAPACENSPEKSLARPGPRLPASRPEQESDARNGEDPDRQVKETVLRVLALEVLDGRGLAGGRRADHVVPAEDLVEDNAVEEAAKAKAENYSGAKERGISCLFAHVCPRPGPGA